MHYKTNRLNHDFQIAYFLAGSCHTPDGAYGLLCDLEEDRENALRSAQAQAMRVEAKKIAAKRALKTAGDDEAAHLMASADLVEAEHAAESMARNVDAAQRELATIRRCKSIVEPMRQYAHLPLADAHEAAQREEWCLEFIRRAENSLMASGNVPTDQIAAMRQHPDFATRILPAIDNARALLASAAGRDALLARKPVPFLPAVEAALRLEAA